MDDVGRAGRAERNPGHDDDPLIRLGDAVAQRHALGLGDHLLEIGDVARPHRVGTP